MHKKKKTNKPVTKIQSGRSRSPKKTKNPPREKVIGQPTIVKPATQFYNMKTGEIYPKIFFRQDTIWDKIKRFFGYLP